MEPHSVVKHLSLSKTPDTCLIEKLRDIAQWNKLMTGVQGQLNQSEKDDYEGSIPQLLQISHLEIMHYLLQDGEISFRNLEDSTNSISQIVTLCKTEKRKYYSLVRAFWLYKTDQKIKLEETEQKTKDDIHPCTQEYPRQTITKVKDNLDKLICIDSLTISEEPSTQDRKLLQDIRTWKRMLKSCPGLINDKHDNDFLENYVELASITNPSEIMDYLMQDGQMNDEQRQKIEVKASTKDQMRAIIRICRNTERGYYSFVRAKWLSIEKSFTLHECKGTYTQTDPEVPSREKIVEKLKQKLGLDSYKHQIGIQDVIRVRSKCPAEEDNSIALSMLSSLIKMDYRGREKSIHMDDEVRSFLDSFLEISEAKSNDAEDISSADVHPLDAWLILFNCCDMFLQQVLFQKLFMCKLALPFLYPSVPSEIFKIPAWSFGGIELEYQDKLHGLTQVPADQHPLPIVSFLRFGRPAFPKSKLLNAFLSKTDKIHHTFYNSECRGGFSKRLIADGLVECFWYMPSGTENDNCFDKLAMFLNQRGDALDFAQQTEVIAKSSSAVVVIVDMDMFCDMNTQEALLKLHKSQANAVLIMCGKMTDTQKAKQAMTEYTSAIEAEKLKVAKCIGEYSKDCGKNIITVKQELSKVLKEVLLEPATQTISDINKTAAEILGSQTDIEQSDCNHGYIYACEVMKSIETYFKGKPINKSKLLPLQGTAWFEYSKLLREKERIKLDSGKTETLVYRTDELQEQMKTCRERQEEDSKHATEALKCFIYFFILGNLDEKLYFLNWLKRMIDQKVSPNTKALQKYYCRKWGDLQNIKGMTEAATESNGDAKKRIELLKVEVEQAEKKLLDCTFGIEHMLRELAQFFEATQSKTSYSSDTRLQELHRCPDIMAKLIVKGYPFEIMDGDAANIPITWLHAVFQCLHKELGDKRVLILTVFGIQSSGKTTLFNTMFGLQLSVGTGRCTRGVYGQLLQVGKKEALPFDYVMVIDTEGLRGPDFDERRYNHDNELATLAVGLGDITIVNIKGENTTEVKDVLQIVVHAFLRMWSVRKHLALKHSCVFVHQNVSAIDAGEKLLPEKQKLQDMLDRMTSEAAEEEGLANIHSFKDVIGFDCKENVCYLSDLWEGEPPMAPVNTGYSEKVAQVQVIVIEKLARKPDHYHSPISQVMMRIKDLWNAILADDFVYRFRNSLEIKAYTGLESKVCELEWDFNRFTIDWVNNQAEVQLTRCEREDDLDQCTEMLLSKFDIEASSQIGILFGSLDKYFNTSDVKDILAQWKDWITEILRKKVKVVKEEAVYNMCQIKRRQTQMFEHKRELRGQETVIMKKAKAHAVNLRKRVSDDEVHQEFEKMWNEWILQLGVKKPLQPDLAEDIDCYLLSCFAEKDKQLLTTEMAACPKRPGGKPECSIPPYKIDGTHFVEKKMQRFLRKVRGIFKPNSKVCDPNVEEEKENLRSFLKKEKLLGIFETNEGRIDQWLNLIGRLNSCFHEKNAFELSPHFKAGLTASVCKFVISNTSRDTTDHGMFESAIHHIMSLNSSGQVSDMISLVRTEALGCAEQCSYDTVNEYIDRLSARDLCTKEQQIAVAGAVNVILKKIAVNLSEQGMQIKQFNLIQVNDIISTISKRVADFNKTNNELGIKLLLPLEIKAVVVATRFAVDSFERMQAEYNANHGPYAELQKGKQKIYHMFKNTLEEALVEVLAADLFSDSLEVLVLQKTKDSLAIPIVEALLQKFPKKFALIKSIQEDLMKKDFPTFMKYIQNAESFASDWIQLKTDLMLFDVGSGIHYSKLANNELTSIFTCIKKSVREASSELKLQTTKQTGPSSSTGKSEEAFKLHMDHGTGPKESEIEKWSKAFCENVSVKLAVPYSALRELRDHPVTNFTFFQDQVIKRLETLEDNCKQHFENVKQDKLRWKDTPPHRQVMDRVWGCSAQCPFCHEPCQYNEPNHLETGIKHRCVQHRPLGINGWRMTTSKMLSVGSCDYVLHINKAIGCGRWSQTCIREKGQPCTDEKGNLIYHPLREHHKYIPDWEIAPCSDITNNKYWVWFMKTYVDDLVEHYKNNHVVLPAIPKSWEHITQNEAMESLKEY